MKLNAVQKILLLMYLLLFLFISMIRVPFRTGRSIAYDTIFTSNGNVDFGRWTLFMIVATVTVGIAMILARNAAIKMKKLLIGLSVVVIIGIIGVSGYFYYVAAYTKKRTEPVEEVTIVTDSAITTPSSRATNNAYMEEQERKKKASCNEDKALQLFHSYMKFNYPDYKIYGKPVVKKYDECTFRVQFTSIDPHIQYQKEVFIVQISINAYEETYNFSEIRGTLY
jgi:hypothetical protein